MREMNKSKVRQFLNRWLPYWCVLPLASILLVNAVAYFGTQIFTKGRPHVDLTTDFDRAVPLIPGFIWIYLLAFAFWGANYILAAQRGKMTYYRFVATDLSVHLCCLLIFLILPTTNVRPEILGNSLSERALRWLYATDGGSMPTNLLPSIHCYVSWLCYRGIKGSTHIPVWYQRFSLVFAILVVISTQVLKQHYIVDAIAALALVEFFWWFYRKGERVLPLRRFFEALDKKYGRSDPA